MIPEVRAVNSQLHLTYNCPGRIHTIEPYPLPAPNGSAILLLGHEKGLRVLWHGGRTLKSQDEGHQENGSTNPGQSIVLDSDDEADSPVPNDQDSYLDSDEEDYDPSKPFERIVQSLDLHLGVAVLHIAFPSCPIEPLQPKYAAFPPLFSENIVAAITCSDASVRIITLPVAPPSSLRKRKAAANEKSGLANGSVGPYGERITTSSKKNQISKWKKMDYNPQGAPRRNGADRDHRQEVDLGRAKEVKVGIS
ncbi:MAG: hypothetical protein Q9192_005863 [Flavoplaca navasiana]